MNFADRLITRVRSLGHPLCIGLDPHFPLIPNLFKTAGRDEVDAIRSFLRAVLERSAGKAAVVKPQSAFYELHGWRGVHLLQEIVDYSRELGFLMVLDAKRGDIGSTAQGYADAYLSSTSPISVDALTVNPYLGRDTIEPFIGNCRKYDRGIFTLVKTSNPGSGDFQDVDVDGGPLYGRVASALQDFEQQLAGPETGWSSSGVVVGATYPEQAIKLRELLPRSLFLVPGFGSQGGSANDAVCSFVAGPSGVEGGIVNSSRGILFPSLPSPDCGAAQWENAFDSGLQKAVEELSYAVNGS